MRIPVYKRIFLNFVLIIVLFGVMGAILSASLISRNTLNEAQRRVSLDLRAAWSIIQGEMDSLRLFAEVLTGGRRVANAYTDPRSSAYRAALEAVRRKCGFDFLSLTDSKGQVIVRTLEPYHAGDYLSNEPLIRQALQGKTVGGFVLLGPQRLHSEGGDLEERAFMVFKPTAKAKPRAKTAEASGMALMTSAPVRDDKGTIIGALYAGVLLNRNHALADKIRSIVFEDKTYEGRDLGTVTIFQWDARIATNVMTADGNRAIGTRVSSDVYDKVLENDRNWYDRAFVVNDWYISAYDPIHDIEGKVIGILYVGVLAKKYDDIKRSLWKLYGAVSIGVVLFVLAVGFIFSRRLTGSLSRLADASRRIADGELDLKVPEPSTDDEVLDLTRSFNAMASSLRDRDEQLRKANTELEAANASLQQINANYLDMLGFVSHELKNTLGVIYTSAHALDTGITGPLTENQGALVKNISKSIDRAVRMTRNYLDLARIEKGELIAQAKPIDLVRDVVSHVIDELGRAIEEKGMKLESELPASMPYSGDPDLLQIVYKNLLHNALKYGMENGTIRLGFREEETAYRFEVWNQGQGLSPEEIARLFQRFVRLGDEVKGYRSTGLGLFITKEIIEKHGGAIRAESHPGEWINFIFTLPK
jgi:two-component system NtrC family sensor kinase